jgi:hypothetical protein
VVFTRVRLLQKLALLSSAQVQPMRIARLGSISLVVCLALASRLPAQTSAAPRAGSNASGKAADELAARFGKLRSIPEIDHALKELEDGPKPGRRSLLRLIGLSSEAPGQANLELLMDGWGRHGLWFDLAVMRYIWKSWPRIYTDDGKQFDALRLITILRSRVEEQPKLLGQLFWYVQWEHRGLTFKDICYVIRAAMSSDHSCAGSEFPGILFAAGALGQPWLLESGTPPKTAKATSEQVCDSWTTMGYPYFLAVRPFLRYDSRNHVFVYDQVADRENRYLKSEEQDPPCPSTPLPEWDSKIVPEPPAREK